MSFSYGPYADILSRFVNDAGFVDYAGLKANRGPLDEFVARLGLIGAAEFAMWPREERLAFWINAYNAITLKYIIDHYPIRKGGLVSGIRYPENSVRQIPGVWTRLATPVAGADRTLDDIEHKILRVEFGEPRIHVAINCASVSCPPLRNEPYIAQRLEEQLADQSRRFVAHERNVRIDREAGRVYLSSIFDWFGEDFVEKYGVDDGFPGHNATLRAVLNFVAQYAAPATAEYLRAGQYQVSYIEYDWTLNES